MCACIVGEGCQFVTEVVQTLCSHKLGREGKTSASQVKSHVLPVHIEWIVYCRFGISLRDDFESSASIADDLAGILVRHAHLLLRMSHTNLFETWSRPPGQEWVVWTPVALHAWRILPKLVLT